jgi:hypothetical protein
MRLLRSKQSQNKFKKFLNTKTKRFLTKCKLLWNKSRKFQNLDQHQAIKSSHPQINFRNPTLPRHRRLKLHSTSNLKMAKKRRKRRKRKKPWTQMSSLDKTLKSRSKSGSL